MNKAIHNLQVFLMVVAAPGALMMSAPLVFVFGPKVEAVLLPVVTEMKVMAQTRDGDAVVLEIEGVRRREQCQLEAVTALAISPGAPPELVPITFPKSANKGRLVSRPAGFQSFGTWRIAAVNKGDRVQVTLRYACHSLWDFTTRLGPWEVTQ